jgi:uncharacterized protein (TIGR03790 family)
MRARRFLAFLLLAILAVPAFAGGGPAETVVLLNESSPDSKKVAEYYVKMRNIPPQQICRVKCAAGLETSIEDFVRDVVDPLRTFLRSGGLEERCRFVVMTQGMPILAKTPGGAVSTASALSLLHTSVCGQPQTRFPVWKHEYTAGAIGTPVTRVEGRLLFVTALISTTADEAIVLVDRSVASDGTAPAGARFIFQDANGAAGVRNPYYDAARKVLEALGFATQHEPAGADVLKGREKLMGFMSGGSYSNLTVDGVNAGRYLPGAICDLLQSFGAVPGNFEPEGKRQSQFPVTHMVRAGVTGVHGAVAEPYNIAFPDWELFKPYVEGFTLAETFHQRMPYVYWMNLTLGDPLCAPYAKRPKPVLTLGKTDARSFTHAKLAAPGAVRIDVYVEGKLEGSVQGDSGELDLPLFSPFGSPCRVLVEATGAGPAEPRGWTVLETAGQTSSGTAVGVGRMPLPFEKLAASAPATVRAGDAFDVKVEGQGGDAKPGEGRKLGRVEIRTASPPVRWAFADAESLDTALPMRLTRAGDQEFSIVAADWPKAAPVTVKVHIDAGPFHHATCPSDSFPLNQECDMEVVLEDEFGNRAKEYDGTIALEVPQDRFATLPAPVAVVPAHGGRRVLAGVLLTHAGATTLVFKDAGSAVVSQQGEGVTVAKAAIRPWLVAGPVPMKDLASGDPSAGASGDGSVAAKTLLRRRVLGDVLQLPAGNAKGGDAALLVTWLESLGATKARLLAAAPGRVRVLLDGKEVFHAVPKATDSKGKREPVAEFQLPEGTHRLAVVVETKGATSASFEIDDGNGQFPASLRIRARSGAPPKTLVVSGRVTAGPGAAGIGGAKVTVKGADGKERIAMSAADGAWWVEGLPAGETVVTVAAGVRTVSPPERALTLEERNAVDVDFAAAGGPAPGKK